jgi:quercetin dioxygenase-like cupin family protein
MLTTYLADAQTTNGAFTLIEVTIPSGSELAPHVHSREDEIFYVLEGEFDIYVGDEAFTVQTGECIFLPRTRSHGWVIRSARLRMLTLFTPGGVEKAFAARVRLPGIWIFRPGRSRTRRAI